MRRMCSASMCWQLMLAVVLLLPISAFADEPMIPDDDVTSYCHGSQQPMPAMSQQTGMGLAYVTSFAWRNFNDVAVRGDYAYCLAPFGMQVYDISDPSAPEFISQLYLQGYGHHIVIDGYLAFAAHGTGGLKIVNLIDPANPVLVGEYRDGSDVLNVSLRGSHAYLSCGYDGFRVVDVGIPSQPRLVASEGPLGPYYSRTVDFAFYGTWAYRADLGSGVALYDISDPTNPRYIKRCTPTLWSSQAGSLTASGHYLFIGNSSGLAVTDLTDPQNPALVTRRTDFSVWESEMDVADDRLYVLAGEGFRVFDLSNPDTLSLVARDTTHFTSGFALDGDRLITTGGREMAIYTIAGDNPNELGRKDIGYHITNCVILGNELIVGTYRDSLLCYEITDPGRPIFTRSIRCPGTNIYVSTVGEMLYAVAIDSGLRVFDLTAPEPVPVAYYRQSTGSMVGQLIAAGDYGYVTSQTGSYPNYQYILHILDIRDPANPVFVKSVAMDHGIFFPTVAGNVLLGNDWQKKALYAIDISDPVNPIEYRYDIIDDEPHGMCVAGPYVYFAACNDGTHVLDVSNPGDVRVLTTFSVGDGSDYRPLVVGDRLYLAQWEGGVQIYDISDPLHPVYAGREPVGVSAMDVVPVGDNIYVEDISCGIAVFRPAACCAGTTGNIDCDPNGNIDVSDLSALIDNLFIGFAPLCCTDEAKIDGVGTIDVGDLSRLIDYLFLTFTSPGACPQ